MRYPFDDTETAAMQEWINGNVRHIPDALIANTARRFGFVLVTEDQRMTARAWLLGMTVWDYARFSSHVCQ